MNGIINECSEILNNRPISDTEVNNTFDAC